MHFSNFKTQTEGVLCGHLHSWPPICQGLQSDTHFSGCVSKGPVGCIIAACHYYPESASYNRPWEHGFQLTTRISNSHRPNNSVSVFWGYSNTRPSSLMRGRRRSPLSDNAVRRRVLIDEGTCLVMRKLPQQWKSISPARLQSAVAVTEFF